MSQCGQSEIAPYYIAAAGQIVQTAEGNGFSVPGYVDPEHDILLAMMQWVENGTAPEQLIATKWNNDTLEDGIVMQRTLCPYPQKAIYGGSGDWHAASSWSCQEGDLLPFPTKNGSIGTVKAVDGQSNDTGGCIDNCTNSDSSNGGNGSSSKSGSKSEAKALRVMGEDVLKLAGWVFLALLGVGYMF
jgi:hypothetical protein